MDNACDVLGGVISDFKGQIEQINIFLAGEMLRNGQRGKIHFLQVQLYFYPSRFAALPLGSGRCLFMFIFYI